MLELEFALVEQPRLLAEAGFKILRAAAEDFRFLGLRHQLLLEFGDAAAEVLDPAALFRQFLRRGLQFDPLGIPAILDRLQFVAGSVQPLFQRLDLGLERDDFDLLGVGEGRALVQFAHQLGEFGFLVGQARAGHRAWCWS